MSPGRQPTLHLWIGMSLLTLVFVEIGLCSEHQNIVARGAAATKPCASPELCVKVVPIRSKLRYSPMHQFGVIVTNHGSVIAKRVSLVLTMGPGTRVLHDSSAMKTDESGLTVRELGDIPDGESKEVTLGVCPSPTGYYFVDITVQEDGRALRRTNICSLPTIMLESTISDNKPRIADKTTYEVRIANAGADNQYSLKLACTIPKELSLVGVPDGPTRCQIIGQTLVFEPLLKLDSNTHVRYRITLVGDAKGKARLEARVQTLAYPDPQIEFEEVEVLDYSGVDSSPPR